MGFLSFPYEYGAALGGSFAISPLNSSFPEGARSHRFNHTRLLKKKKKTLKVTKVTGQELPHPYFLYVCK